MTALLHRQPPPSEVDVALARNAEQNLTPFAQRSAPLTITVTNTAEAQPIELPAGAVALLMEILTVMSTGRGVTIIPENAELTTVEAADVLNVSRPFLIKLLEEGKIPHRKVGRHRRIRMEDVMAYKDAIDREREAILDELVSEAQELDMGYSKA
jgi:excisionase family DNA binding protein